MKGLKELFKHYRNDLPAGLVVYFVALPLCLAIAQVSTGRPDLVFSGVIAGIVGGMVVGALSGSALGVSGPAAGLVVIVFDGIQTLSRNGDPLSGFRALLLATVIAGVIQILAGYAKAGIIGSYFPSSVIKGMLAAIGITIILKEIPHALGYDKDFMGDESFVQKDGHNTFTELYYAVRYNSTAAVIISAVSIPLLIWLERPYFKKMVLFRYVPAALFAVLAGIGINMMFGSKGLSGEHLVQLPVAAGLNEFAGFFLFPDFTAWKNPEVYTIAVTLAIIASLESLLSLEATDKLDPLKRISPGNRELKAQGVGNMVSGMLGGLPVTQVIVRSSANINSGGQSRLSTITHGAILLISAIFIPALINHIPLASLAVILILVGYKLARVSLFRQMYRLGWDQFIPFMVTVTAILFTDLLKGILIGMAFAFFYILRATYRNAYRSFTEDHDESEVIRLELSDQVSFLNKGVIMDAFTKIPDNSRLIIDGTRSRYIDQDVLEVIAEFYRYGSKPRNIEVELIRIPELPEVTGAH